MNQSLAREFTQARDACTLLLCAVDLFGLDVLAGDSDTQWDPQTLYDELTQTAGAAICPANFDKLMAALEILTTDHFEQSLPDFIRICNVLNDSPTDGTFDPADASEIGWGILEFLLLRGEAPQLTAEIQGYIEQMMRQEGMTMLSTPFDIAVTDPQANWGGSARAADDADLFELGQDAEDEHTAQIESYVSARLRQVITEVSQLPLSTRDEQWRQNLLSELKGLLSNARESSASALA